MGFSYKKGTLTKITSVATQAIDVGFLPKALRLWTTYQTAEGFAARDRWAMGISDGTTHRSVCQSGDDNVSTSNYGKRWAAKVLTVCDSSEITLSECDVSFSGTSFTLDWTTNDAVAAIVHYEAFGGSTLTNAKVAEITEPAATGNVTYTPSIQADNLFFISGSNITVTPGTSHSSTDGVGWGAAQSSTARWANSVGSRDDVVMATFLDVIRAQRTDCCGLRVNSNTRGVRARFDFVSKTSTQFTINWITRNVTGAMWAYLALEGGTYDVGAFNKTLSAATVAQNVTAPNFQPSGVLLSTYEAVAGTTVLADSDVSVGAFDGTNEGCIWSQTKDLTINTEANSSHVTTKAIRTAESPSTTLSEADSSMISTGFSLSWTTNDTVIASEICYVAYPNAGADVPGGRPTIQIHIY